MNSFPFDVEAKMFTEALTLIPCPRQNDNTDCIFTFQNRILSKEHRAGSRTKVKYLRWEDKF